MRKTLLLGAAALSLGFTAAQAAPAANAKPSDAVAMAKPSFGRWGVDLTARDLSVQPGDDFDMYANGAWKKRSTIPADQASSGAFYDVYNLSQDQVRTIIAAEPKTSQIGAMYASYMDLPRLEQLDAKPLAPDLARVAAIDSREAFTREMGASLGRFGIALFDMGPTVDPASPDNNVLYVSQSGIGLPDRDYYLTAAFKPQRDAYRAYIERTLTMIGYADPAASADAIMAFETAVAKASWAAADRRDLDKTNNPMNLAELQAYAPQLDWAAYLSAAGIARPGKLQVQEKSAIQAIAAVYAATPLSTLKAWEAFHIASQASPYLSDRFVQSDFTFKKALSGVSQLRPRWKRGGSLIDATLGEELGHAYADRYFPASSKAQMEVLVANLKTALAARIEKLSWMSPATKQEALKKLAKMDVMVGYPDKWRDYSGLKIDPTDLYGNVERANAFEWNYQLSKVYHPVDRKLWGMTPQTVNAYNGEFENKIVFPAAILQPPFFNPSADPAVNYGAIGVVIGHEISHGFDDQGRKIDDSGAKRDWWTPQDAKRFEVETAAYGKQFDSYEPVPGAHINGELTMGENVADMAGLLTALDAYHASLHGKPAPVIDGLTGDQRFFLAYAQVWRALQRPDAVRQQLASDPHSPDRFRIIGPLRNVDAWYAAFHVTAANKYYVAPSERVRIW